jgi:hypothetical protein
MGSKKPFLILIGVVAISILAAVLLSRIERTSAPLAPEETVSATVQPTPSPAPSRDPEDFSTSRRISRDEYQPYYDTLVKTASDYTTAQVRTILSLPQFVEDEVVEAEVRFDAVRPERWARQIFASRPENRIDPYAEWEFLPRSGTLATWNLWRNIEYDHRTAFEHQLDATDEFLAPYLEKKRQDFLEQFANPHIDLLFEIPIEDRLREVVEAEEIKTSEGLRIRVLMRLTSTMAQEITRGKLRLYFPVCPDCAKAVSLREDWFAADTMDLEQSVYLKPDRTPFLVQRYVRTIWDERIPDDRFELPMPDGGRVVDIVEDQRKKMEKYEEQGGEWSRPDPDAMEVRQLLKESENKE